MGVMMTPGMLMVTVMVPVISAPGLLTIKNPMTFAHRFPSALRQGTHKLCKARTETPHKEESGWDHP